MTIVFIETAIVMKYSFTETDISKEICSNASNAHLQN